MSEEFDTFRFDLSSDDLKDLKRNFDELEEMIKKFAEFDAKIERLNALEAQNRLEAYLSPLNRIKTLLERPKRIKHSVKKFMAIEEARKKRSNDTKAKIQNAINLLRIEGKETTPYQVAKTAGISFVTAKKYLKQINYLKENERSE